MIFLWRLQLLTCVPISINVQNFLSTTLLNLHFGGSIYCTAVQTEPATARKQRSISAPPGTPAKARRSAKAKSLKLMYYTREQQQQQSFTKLWQYLATTFSLSLSALCWAGMLCKCFSTGAFPSNFRCRAELYGMRR